MVCNSSVIYESHKIASQGPRLASMMATISTEDIVCTGYRQSQRKGSIYPLMAGLSAFLTRIDLSGFCADKIVSLQ